MTSTALPRAVSDGLLLCAVLTPLDTAVRGYEAALRQLCSVTPAGLVADAGGVRMLFSGALIPTLNVVALLDDGWSAYHLEGLARRAAAVDVPWSVLLRVGADGTNAARVDEAAAIASSVGLASRSEMPFMTCSPSGYRPRRATSPRIEVATASEWREYTDVLADGFEAPKIVFGGFMAGGVLDAPGFTGYLARCAAEATGTGFGARLEESVGVFNIAVPPAHRRAGLGRAITERIVDDGFRAGAGVAYLHATAAGQPLYASMGFDHVETWLAFT